MAVTINAVGTYFVTRVNNANTLTGWSAATLEGTGGGPSAQASIGSIDLVKEGSNAVASIANKQRVALRVSFASTNLTGKNVYLWGVFLAAGTAFTKANGGMQIELSSSGNRNYYNIAGSDTYSGGFVKWAVDTSKTPFENSGIAANITAITDIGFVCDVGGATTRFDNMVVDAIDVGTGLTFQGTTATNKLFLEAATVDEATAIGVLSRNNGIVFSQGSVEFSGTAQTSIGETMVFTDTLLGAFTYQCDITGAIVFTNSSISAAGLVNYNFDTSGAISFEMTGGSLSNCNQLTVAAGQILDGAVLSNVSASLMTSSTVTRCTWVGSGLVTQSGASITGSIFDGSTGAVSLLVDNISLVTGNTFTSDGTNHAVDLGTITANITLTWNNSESGYVAGTAGTGVDDKTPTGNETILCNVDSGFTLTINVGDNGSTPSVSNTGLGSVDVVVGQTTFAFTLNPLITGYEWRMYEDSGVPGQLGTVILDGEETATADNQSYVYTYSVDTDIVIQVIAEGYEEFQFYGTLSNINQSFTFNLEAEDNT
jgi:hypothetical protein